MTTTPAALPKLDSITSDAGPISESSRVIGIDVARGIALLGIFFVNAVIFGEPFGDIMTPHAPEDEGPLSVVVYWFTAIFCSGKFYPLFSILFGVGLAMMFQSSKNAGRKFGWSYFRRLVVLGLFGIAHIVFLWPGDILLIYASIGLWMLLLGRCSPKTLLITGGSLFAVGVLLTTGMVTLMSATMPKPDDKAEPRPMPEASTRLEQFGKVLNDLNPNEPYDSRIKEIERAVLTEGPFLAAAAVRVFNYSWLSVFIVLVLFWIVLPCFCLGAALLKLGFLHGQMLTWRKRFIVMGLAVGLPLNILGAIGGLMLGNPLWLVTSMLAINIGGPMMSLMYLSLILNWVDSGRAAILANALANLGRMALTGYLLESFLMSAVMLHWGLAKFGSTTWAERAGWVIVIYLAIVLFANLWMRRFRFGPLEWLWRSLTYWRRQPLLR